jgi:hypothetical protein
MDFKEFLNKRFDKIHTVPANERSVFFSKWLASHDPEMWICLGNIYACEFARYHLKEVGI